MPKKKQKTEKAAIISWLLDLDDVSFKEELRGFAEAKEWKKFANTLKKRWVRDGKDASACDSLQNSQNAIHVCREGVLASA